MSRWKKGMVVILVFILTSVLFAACSEGGDNGNEQAADTGPSEPAGSDQPGNETMADSDVYWVDAMYMYDWFTEKTWMKEDPVTPVFTEKTGVAFNFRGASGDGDQRANVMLVSGDYPEVMYMDRGPTWDKYVASGALYAIDELAEQYGFEDMIGENIPQATVDGLLHPDGHLYAIPSWFSDDGLGDVGRTISVRNDIFEKFGSPQFDTMDEYLEFLIEIRDAGLTFEGQRVYPLGLWWNEHHIVEMSNIWGNQARKFTYYDEEEKRVRFFLYHEATHHLLRWLNRAYREDLVDPENFTWNNTRMEEEFSTGKFATVMSDLWNLWTPSEVTRAIDPNVFYKSIPLPAGIEGVKPYYKGYSTVGSQTVAVITKNAKDPEAIMRFYDYYLSPEGQILNFYGIEGETWEYNDEGIPMLYDWALEAKMTNWDGTAIEHGIRHLDLNNSQKYNWERHQEPEDRAVNRRIAMEATFDGTLLDVLKLDGNSSEGISFANIEAQLLTDITRLLMLDSEEAVNQAIEDLLTTYENMGLAAVEEEWTNQYHDRLEIIEQE